MRHKDEKQAVEKGFEAEIWCATAESPLRLRSGQAPMGSPARIESKAGHGSGKPVTKQIKSTRIFIRACLARGVKE
jgi:hypothetical protein